MTATKTGFQVARAENVTLQVEQAARLDLRLEVGNVSESVEVSATAGRPDARANPTVIEYQLQWAMTCFQPTAVLRRTRIHRLRRNVSELRATLQDPELEVPQPSPDVHYRIRPAGINDGLTERACPGIGLK